MHKTGSDIKTGLNPRYSKVLRIRHIFHQHFAFLLFTTAPTLSTQVLVAIIPAVCRWRWCLRTPVPAVKLAGFLLTGVMKVQAQLSVDAQATVVIHLHNL